MKELIEKIKAFLADYQAFYKSFREIKTDDPNDLLDTLGACLSDTEKPLLAQDFSKMAFFFGDEVKDFVKLLHEKIYLENKEHKKAIVAARGKLPEAAAKILKTFEEKINQDLNLARIKEFERRLLVQLKEDNEKTMPANMESHLENIASLEKMLASEDEKKKVSDVHVAILQHTELFEKYLRQIRPLLDITIKKLKDAELQLPELIPHFETGFESSQFFYFLLHQELKRNNDWPHVPAQLLESLQAMQNSLSYLVKVMSQSPSNNEEVYEEHKELDKFRSSYTVYLQCIPQLKYMLRNFNVESGSCSELVKKMEEDIPDEIFKHTEVEKARDKASAYFKQRKREYISAFKFLQKNLKETQERYETWVSNIDLLLTERLPAIRETVFKRMSVSLKFQHVRNCSRVLQNPEGDLTKVNRDLCKKILLTFLYTGRSREIFIDLQKHANRNTEKKSRINIFLNAFHDEKLTTNLAGIWKIFTDAEEDEALMSYTAYVGIDPVARVSRTKDLIMRLHCELERIIERENQTQALLKSVESSIQEEEARLFNEDYVAFNFEKVFDQFMIQFKESFTQSPEMLKLREEMVNIHCWPLCEESKFVRMWLALTHTSTHMQIGKIKTVNEVAELVKFARQYYPQTAKKGELAFSFAYQSLRSRLSTVETQRKATLLLLFKSLDRIALRDELGEKEKLKVMQQVVGYLVIDIRNSTRGSEGWLVGRNGSKLAAAIEEFMENEWTLDVPQFLSELRKQEQDPLVSSLSL